MSRETHYQCDVDPDLHERRRRVGFGHRAGCAVASGHTPGSAASNKGCRQCRIENQRKFHHKRRIRRYGLNPAEYLAMAEAQHFQCAICGQQPADKRLAVDHDHITGRIRGLLCTACNLAIGNFDDDPERMRRAITYLS